MTKAEAVVWNTPKWKQIATYELPKKYSPGENYQVRVYENAEDGYELHCDSWMGDSILVNKATGHRENVESNYECLTERGLV